MSALSASRRSVVSLGQGRGSGQGVSAPVKRCPDAVRMMGAAVAPATPAGSRGPSICSESRAGIQSRPHCRQVQCRAAAHTVSMVAAPPPEVSAAAAAPESAWAQLVAVLLGWGVLAGSCFRSVPQIVKIVQAGGNTEGLSLTSNVVELLCYAVMVGYNLNRGYPLNTYAEVFVCYLQDIVLVALILRHLRTPLQLVAPSTLAFCAFCAWLFIPGACPMPLLDAMQLSTLFVLAFGSRLPQIVLNWKRGDSGLLSLTSCVLNVSGCIVRAFTTIVLTQDMLLLSSCILQGILNAVLLWQVLATRLRGRRGLLMQT